MIVLPVFLKLAFLGAIIASFSSGIMGSYVVIKRISSITGSISHSILGGIGFFEYLNYKYDIPWLDPMLGAVIAALISAFLIGYVHLNFKQKEDAVIAIIWSCGMAIGVIFLTLVPYKEATCTHFLFGDIFTTGKVDILILSILAVFIVALTILFYRKFLIICFDEKGAYLQKIPIKTFYFLLLAMISISIVLLVKIIGIILIIALLTIPATIANFFTYRLPIMMIIAVILSILFNTIGISFSYIFSWPPGATIAIVVSIFYIFALLIKKLLYRME
ncbi:MAG: Manganese transport system membrane protein MntB [Candidatus Anoxychlamydiales bacterium]|nr:Manganese transport system membrane protein MntB [Candidatus Anoxychlamydiales bacterium]NGX41615.1 Manganese transport system membrane protein MntB [Candidatus Anoxychlamydiales bacterium]